MASLENLSRVTKNSDTCKVSLRKNLLSLKPLISFSIKHVRLTLFTLMGEGREGGRNYPPPMMIFFNYSGTANAAELKFLDLKYFFMLEKIE